MDREQIKQENEKQKNLYWDYFTSDEFKKYRPHGCTERRLKLLKPTVFASVFFWADVIGRHGGFWNGFSSVKANTPQELRKQLRPDQFNHCIGNFYGMIFDMMYQAGMVK